ncbi:hypothetical protein HPO_01360 [Hyphomonas polymorpha PS728]|uniref:Class I SAM-dependent methyltransferase n=1 Tax=Hyphomonas polymorpha PS728 TaxID=1280954 RepID=A0A062VDM1_9PROT|nr:class I SAM-dependent methyltransferase [Hyphomonas polymorpha]KDA00635.1 hypothetical protein HPO_01360 [Hyphomonas polymorpha PS728]
MQRPDIINTLASKMKYQSYLEIGVEAGVTFRQVEVASKVAVDPDFKTDTATLGGEAHSITSDAFFARDHRSFDCTFVDGLHTFEQSLRDFENAWARRTPRGIVIVDDCYPSDDLAALPDHAECVRRKIARGDADRNWMGDVYKTVIYIHDFTSHEIAFVEGSMGVVVVWPGHRATAPWLGTRSAIEACTLDQFRSLTLPVLPLDEITARICAM